MREALNNQLKTAMKAGDKRRVDTIRLINAALKDKDIEARGLGKSLTEADILALLQKMVKSRQESLQIYQKAGREDLATVEAEEIAILLEFLPKPLSENDVEHAITEAISATGATTIKDMGKVVAALKARFTGQMDFSKVSAEIKRKLGG
jgi:uncharacterized protein YqeY